MGELFWEKTNSSRFSWPCARLSGRRDSLSVSSSPKTFMSATRASGLYPHGPTCTKDCRDFDWRSLTANFELMLVEVCHEMSMRLCFWLTAVIATRQERLPSLLVDPACKLKLCVVREHAGLNIRLWRRSKDVAVVVWLPPRWRISEPLSLPLCNGLVFFCHSSSPELSHGVVMSLARQGPAHAVEHR